MNLAGAVLTGGASRRMGADKALLEVDGRAMSVRVAAALRAAGCAPVFAVGGASARLRAAGLDVIADEHPGEGPLGGILTALRHVGVACPGVVVVACDLPMIDAATISAVAGALGDHDVAAARTDGPHPLVAAWSTRAWARVQARFDAGERAVRRVTAELDLVEVAVRSAVTRNVNTPDELAAVRASATRPDAAGSR
jgi:molybdopterin-guanine dinucleotide biosynthesis protein A